MRLRASEGRTWEQGLPWGDAAPGRRHGASKSHVVCSGVFFVRVRARAAIRDSGGDIRKTRHRVGTHNGPVIKVLDHPDLDRAVTLRLWHTKNPRHNGRFLVGVLTTGIYCLPTCTARKPKDENVRFFLDEDGARSAGLRACRRCRPDHFYRRFDPDRERVQSLCERLRANPGDFGGVADLRADAGVGATKLNELFRRHYHTTPAAYLLRARLASAGAELVRSKRRVLDIATDAGFESSSAFHEGFQLEFAMSPGSYRNIADGNEFVLRLPREFRSEDAFRMFGRDEDGCTERIDGRRATKALLLDGKPARVELVFSPTRVQVAVFARRAPTRSMMVAAHRRVVRMLGLDADPGAFERRMLRKGDTARLVRGRRGLRIPLTADAFEGLVWVIVGQQVNITFASLCRSRLIQLCGTRIPNSDGFVAHPTAAQVAELDYADLEPLQYSRRKAEYVIDTARAIAAGDLDLDGLRHAPAGLVEERLGNVRGLGPWSVNYLLMRSFGLEDCVPVGDVALEAALERFFELDHRPKAQETLQLMEPFAPHRSLATFHLWRSLGDEE